MRLTGGAETATHHIIGPRHDLTRIDALEHPVDAVQVIGLLMDALGIRGQRLQRVGIGRQVLQLDLDQSGPLAGGLLVNRSHYGYHVTMTKDLGVIDNRLEVAVAVFADIVMLPKEGSAIAAFHVLGGDHLDHAG